MANPPAHLASLPHVAEEPVSATDLDARLRGAHTPFVVRGLAADWPLVCAGLGSGQAARDLVLSHARPRSFTGTIGKAAGEHRLFYDAAMGMNFTTVQGPLEQFLIAMQAAEHDENAPVTYLSSVDMQDYFVGLAEENRVPIGDRRPIESIWIGSQTCIAAHNDVPDNLAICVAGERRFILFPPDQMANLYLGPLENTPAGRPVSMVDVQAPDFDLFPRFRVALSHAQVAVLHPGDAVFVPSLWWHHVEGLARFNILINYWWREVPHFLGQPEDALLHAILSVRDLPPQDKARWRAMFDHYVFDNGPEITAHLPDAARGILAPLTPQSAGQIRAKLLRSLSR